MYQGKSFNASDVAQRSCCSLSLVITNDIMKLPKLLRRRLVKFARKQLLPDVPIELKRVLARLEQLEMAAMNMIDLEGADDLADVRYRELGESMSEWRNSRKGAIRWRQHNFEGQAGNVILSDNASE